jgi:hypothetical protein
MKPLFDDAEMGAQLQRTVVAVNAGAADIGEALGATLFEEVCFDWLEDTVGRRDPFTG